MTKPARSKPDALAALRLCLEELKLCVSDRKSLRVAMVAAEMALKEDGK